MDELIPSLPVPYAHEQLIAWTMKVLEIGFRQTGNGYFAFWALHAALTESKEVDGASVASIPLWVFETLMAFTENLEHARGAAEVAKAVQMHGGKTASRDATEAIAWFERVFELALVKDAMARWTITEPEARKAVAAFLSQEGGSPITGEALRKRIERIRSKAPAAPLMSWPPSRSGQPSRK